MVNSPVLFGPNNTALNLQNQELLANGELIRNNGPKNYIGYNNFQTSLTTGWSLGTVGTLTNGIPTGSPTFGSGASGNLSIATVSSGQLAGTYSLSLVSAAASTQGNMLASDALTLDLEDQAKVLTFTLYYSAASGTTNINYSGTSSNSFGVACYDVTNSSWLPVTGQFSMTQSSGVGYMTGTMQTNATTASVRFILYNVNATAGAATLYLDDFYLGPQTAPYGPVVTDWISFTPTGSWVSNSTYAGKWRRVGDSMEVDTTVTCSGAPTSAGLTFNLPSGYTIDTTKLNNTDSGETLGYGQADDVGTSPYPVIVAYSSTTAVAVYAENASATYLTSATQVTQAVPITFGNTDRVQAVYRVPISGWSSNVQMSNDTDTRVVALVLSGSSTSITSSTVAIVPTTVVNDTHGGFSSTTYTVPVTGYYSIEATITGGSVAQVAGNAIQLVYKKNGGAAIGLGLFARAQASITTSFSAGGATTALFNAGDTIQLLGNADVTQTLTGYFASISRVSGPAVVAATESVNARYYASATSINGSLATIVWSTKDFDSHNGMASGIYTVPVSGKYQINAQLAISGTFALNNQTNMVIQKNSVTVSEILDYAGGIITADHVDVDDIISCNAGDTLKIQLSSGATGPAIVSSNTKNFISIARVGN